MSIRPLSLTGDYHLVWSGDPALDAPPLPDGEVPKEEPPVPVDLPDDHPDAVARRRWESGKAYAEWARRVRLAQQTGSKEAWQTLLKPGQEPTLFRMRQVPPLLIGKLLRYLRSGTLDDLGEQGVLCFRVALEGIDQWAPGVKFKADPFRAVDPDFRDLGQIASPAVCNQLTLPLMNELGAAVSARIMAPDPLS